jgi:hypothetical protein
MPEKALPHLAILPRGENMTKKEIETAVKEVNQQIAALEAKHPEQEMRPWACADHPVALEHWGLVQRRINLKHESRKPTRTLEQRAGLVARLATARALRQNTVARQFSLSQIDDRPLMSG